MDMIRNTISVPTAISRPHLAAIYLRALRNEIAIDIDGYNAIGVTPEECGFLPRLSGIWPRLSRTPRASKLALSFLRILWRHGLYIPFFIGQYLSLRRKTSSSTISRAHETVHILLSSLAPQLLANAEGTDSPAITVPWLQYSNGVPYAWQVSITAVLTHGDLRECLFNAIALTRRISRRNTVFAAWHLQTYTLFRWLCVARALQRIECRRMVIANHYDRWAVMVDRIGGRIKRRPVIVQHGIEAVRRLPTKLQFIDTIYVFDPQQESLFKTFILAEATVGSVGTVYFDNSITLSEVSGDECGVKVVIVGHPEYDANHIRFLEAASLARPDVTFIYKSHPTARSINPRIRALTELWDQQDVFPKCDFVLSYQSTLGYQYRDVGVMTFFHDKTMSDDEIMEAVAAIPKPGKKYTEIR